MISSRLRRFEEKNAKRRMAISLIGSVALLVFIAFFGLRILIGFSLLVDRIRGTTTQSPQQQSVLQPPVLDPLPEATNSATIMVTGRATPKTELTLYINDEEYKKFPVSDDGAFSVDDIDVSEGPVTIRAKSSDDKNNMSTMSNVLTTMIDRTPPKLEIAAPADNTTVNDGTHRVTVEGITDEGMRVSINGRIAVVKSDGSFTYAMSLNDGENKLMITSRDPAGNETTVERTVMYQP